MKYQNQGYATEASKAILEYGFNTMNLDEIVAVCMKKNIACNGKDRVKIQVHTRRTPKRV